VAELMVMKAASQLGLLEVSSDVLVRHLLHACLEQIRFLSSQSCQDLHLLLSHTSHPRTSSSLQARPPPVEAAFLFLLMPYSWRSMASDRGVYGRRCPVICIAGDIVTNFVRTLPWSASPKLTASQTARPGGTSQTLSNRNRCSQIEQADLAA